MWLKSNTTTGYVGTTGANPGLPPLASTWQVAMHFWMDSFPSTFTQLFVWFYSGGGNYCSADSDESTADAMDLYTSAGTITPLTQGNYFGPAWFTIGHTAGTSIIELRLRKPWEKNFSKSLTIDTTTELSGATTLTMNLMNSSFGDNADTRIKGFWIKDYRLSDRELLAASQSYGPPSGKNLTYLPLTDPANPGANYGQGNNWTLNGTLVTMPDGPRISIPKLKKLYVFAATRAAPTAPDVASYFHDSVTSPAIGRARAVRATLSAAYAAEQPLLPLAAPTPSKQFYGDAAQLSRPSLRPDRSNAGSAFPVVVSTTPPLTWFAHSPLRLVKSVGTDAGADAISQLNQPAGTWYPAVPDRGVARRQERDAPGSGLVVPLSVAVAAYKNLMYEAWAPRRRFVTDDRGSGFGERPLYLKNLSWSVNPAYEYKPRRVWWDEPAPSEAVLDERSVPDLSWARGPDVRAKPALVVIDFSAVPMMPVYQPQFPGWFPQPAQIPPKRPLPQDIWDVDAALPVYQPQFPGWVPYPADPVRKFRAPLDGAPGYTFLVQQQAQDLSWARGTDDITRKRQPVQDAPYTNKPTTVTLSSWGWIPQVPERPGLRTVNNAFVSVLVPPAILTAVPWGWIPQVPERGYLRSPITHRDQEPVIPLPGQNLSWAAEQALPRLTRAAREAGFQVLAIPQLATYGWFVDSPSPRLPSPRDASHAVLVVVQAAVPQGWHRDSDAVPGPRRRPEGHSVLPAQPPVQLPSWWFHQQVGPRPPGPVAAGAHVLPFGPVVVVPLSAISWLPQDPHHIRHAVSSALFIEVLVPKAGSQHVRRGRFFVMVPSITGDVFPIEDTDG